MAEFIRNAGGSVATRRILDGESPLKWMLREPSANPVDNGWRFFSEADDDAYLNDPANSVVVDFNTVTGIEPAIIPIWNLPVGSDLQLVVKGGRRMIYDNATGLPVQF